MVPYLHELSKCKVERVQTERSNLACIDQEVMTHTSRLRVPTEEENKPFIRTVSVLRFIT